MAPPYKENLQDPVTANAGCPEGEHEALGSDLYHELRRIAGGIFKGEGSAVTLQPTAVVHEAYLRLAGESDARWNDKAHFLATAARTMRRVLIEAARRRQASRRERGIERISSRTPIVRRIPRSTC